MKQPDLDQANLRGRIVIIVVALMAVGFVVIAPLAQRGRSTQFFARSNLLKVQMALERYKANNGHYPPGTNSLDFLSTEPRDAQNWTQYLPVQPLDWWGHPYSYQYPGRHNTNSFDLSSAGPDGVFGTADDIGNWGQEAGVK